ncbi:D-Ala-D-Ala carboxypeptidase family metallohydrolase [Hyphomicrobium sp. CS1GBMeth3]|uniref:D-Ala-D-Ala carboxypeptidase family metallohydrolase n=1 Tax=Hyphomicrobium sp. CS1GBMeth3 TaxID=1892845 RepID=UPI000ABE65EA|nr:D-Ala-D-Ala carboxypeptidase family metallohydrolase [Hyphomicrobium sp. CS1GBMeth3]
MSKSIFAAVLALGAAAFLAAPAAARVESGVVSSHYERDGRPLPRAQKQRAKKYHAPKARRAGAHTNKKAYRSKSAYKSKKAPVGRKARLANRSMTAVARSGGGATASRGCLKPAAAALLARIESQFGAVKVISTCRPGARIAGSGKPSKHGFGLAVDFDAGARKQAIVNWLRANHTAGGTMTYARMSHIHVDIGPRFVSLGAGGGKRRS